MPNTWTKPHLTRLKHRPLHRVNCKTEERSKYRQRKVWRPTVAVDATVKIRFVFHVCFRPIFLTGKNWGRRYTSIYPWVKQSAQIIRRTALALITLQFERVSKLIVNLCSENWKTYSQFLWKGRKTVNMSGRKRSRSPLNPEENDDDDYDFDENCSTSKLS